MDNLLSRPFLDLLLTFSLLPRSASSTVLPLLGDLPLPYFFQAYYPHGTTPICAEFQALVFIPLRHHALPLDTIGDLLSVAVRCTWIFVTAL